MSLDSEPRAVVLVVEDEWLVSSVVVELLEECGCRVLEASSGEDALAYLGKEPPVDVLLTDIDLGGGVDGWQVAEAFREEDPEVGVIYTSGKPLDTRRDVPDSRFFGKPYRLEDLCESCLRLSRHS